MDDLKQELLQLQQDLDKIMKDHAMDLKGWALSGSDPHKSLSDKSYTMGGGWKWHSKQDKIQLRTPDIYLGTKKKGAYTDKTKILHKNPTEEEINEFYKSETVNLGHVVSRISALFDITGQSAPLCVLGHNIARLAL